MINKGKADSLSHRIMEMDKRLARYQGREAHKVANIRQILLGCLSCMNSHPEMLNRRRELRVLTKIQEGNEILKKYDHKKGIRKSNNTKTTVIGYYRKLGYEKA